MSWFRVCGKNCRIRKRRNKIVGMTAVSGDFSAGRLFFVQQHPEEDFVLWNGNRALIKREQFEKYMDSQMNVI